MNNSLVGSQVIEEIKTYLIEHSLRLVIEGTLKDMCISYTEDDVEAIYGDVYDLIASEI